jgi:hypothetical protein
LNTAPYPLAVTVDIEDWYHIPSVTGSPFSTYRDVDHFFEEWDGPYDCLTEPTRRVLALLERYGVTATFFVVADVMIHYPGLVEEIVEYGHEIASHSMSHACTINPTTKQPLIDVASFEREALDAKRLLEGVSKEKVVGYRAASAYITGWMIDALERSGFQYDSSVSVNSLYNKTDSTLAGVLSAPYYPVQGGLEPSTAAREIVEFPFAYLDAGLKIPCSGGPMLRFLGSHVVMSGLRQSLRRGTTIFYFHPIDISEKHFPEVGKNRPFYWLIKGKVVERRIEWILRALRGKNVRVGPVREMLE